MFELSIKGDFASAHQLRGYQGNCKDLHGHTWRVELTAQSETLDDIGMVVDFKIIKQQFREFLMRIDHVNLNDLPYFKKVNPTSEHLAQYIFQEFGKIIKPLKIKQVRVWESDTSDVTYYE
ncbi:MAG: 6-carboxytetrahydropterin synthase QueD [Omnitrophica WOR_2 bacterium GWA2_47_8]|nr:MAG: 6-carboxytetrahydropterin synthase QueD [Omnitrophica WOR_2 bacterium GWA2_47_8]